MDLHEALCFLLQTYLLDSPQHMQSLNKYAGHFHVSGVILSRWGCSWRQSRHPVKALSFQRKQQTTMHPTSHWSPPVSLSAHNSLPSTCTHFLGFTHISCRELGMIFHSLLGFKVRISLCSLCKQIYLVAGRRGMSFFFSREMGTKKELLNSQLNLIILTDEEIGKIK